GFAYHAVHLVLGQAAGSRDGDLLLAPGRFITRRHIENAVGVDIEGHLDLGHTSWSRGNTFQPEVTKTLVVAGHFALALQHMDLDGWLVIFCRAEDLALARWNGRVAFDQLCHNATQ